MVLTRFSAESGEAHDRGPTAPAVIWHEIECGRYRADLTLWRELAAQATAAEPQAPILDVGAGSGRVTLELARAGRRVLALDRDEKLLAQLRLHAGGVEVETACADARDFKLPRRDFALCVVPMQTIQLLGGSAQRLAFLRCARAHLRSGALLACAIVNDLDEFDCADGQPGPAPETASVDGALFLSRAVRVHVDRRRIRIERDRSILGPGHLALEPARQPERDVVELDRVSVSRLRREGREEGFTPVATRSIAATDEHVGSEVVVLRA